MTTHQRAEETYCDCWDVGFSEFNVSISYVCITRFIFHSSPLYPELWSMWAKDCIMVSFVLWLLFLFDHEKEVRVLIPQAPSLKVFFVCSCLILLPKSLHFFFWQFFLGSSNYLFLFSVQLRVQSDSLLFPAPVFFTISYGLPIHPHSFAIDVY